jgi:hypothetical protein
LFIPESALPFELEISMTPVAALGGLPAEVDMVAAVQIGPEGFLLNAPASLTITPPEEVESPADRMLVGIGFGVGGSDFHFFPQEFHSSMQAQDRRRGTAPPCPYKQFIRFS